MKKSVFAIKLLCLLGVLEAWTPDSYVNDIKLAQGISLSYKLIDNKRRIQFYLRKESDGYFAMGLGTSMEDGDILFAAKNTTHTDEPPVFEECWLVGLAKVECGKSLETWKLRSMDSYDVTGGVFRMEFIRDITIDKGTKEDDYKNFVNGENKIIWAAHLYNNYLSQHSGTLRGRARVKLDLPNSSVIYSFGAMLLLLLGALQF